jgi:hypothetical protein
MKAEIYIQSERLVYLQEELGDQIIVLKEADEADQVKISVELRRDTDLLFIFHSGVRYGLDKMQEVFTKK